MAIPCVSYKNRPLNPERLKAIRRFAGRTILDIGCGPGHYVKELSRDYAIQGVDICSYEAWKDAPHLFSLWHGSGLPFGDDEFDTLLCFEVLEHLEDPFSLLKEFYRVAKRNLLLTVPNCDISPGMQESHLIYSHWMDRGHLHFFDLDSIKELAQRAGFSVSHSTYINPVILSPLLCETLGLPYNGLLSRLGRRLLRPLTRRKYYLTCLIVGDKGN